MRIKKVDGSEWNLDFSSTVINYCFWITKESYLMKHGTAVHSR